MPSAGAYIKVRQQVGSSSFPCVADLLHRLFDTTAAFSMNTLALALLAVVLTVVGRFVYSGYVWRRHAATLASQQLLLLVPNHFD